MSSDLMNVSLLIGFAFFVSLCVVRVLRYIPPLNDLWERRIAALLGALVTGGCLSVLGGLIDKAWLITVGRLFMAVIIWTLNGVIIHYWNVVSKKE